MRYSKDMLLGSDSGFMMPFELDENNSVPVILDYGQQTHPNTGELLFLKSPFLELQQVQLKATEKKVFTTNLLSFHTVIMK